jgi:type III secretion system FlhB-like substrate exporter
MKFHVIICFLFALGFFLNSCNGGDKKDVNANSNTKIKRNKIDKSDKEKFKLDPEKDFIEVVAKGKTSDAEEFIKKANTDTAEIAAKAVLENVLLHFNETEIEDDLLVFGLESDMEINLDFELISDKAIVYAAVQKVNIPSKLVFKALKLNKLKAGVYYFILRDEKGKELIKKIKIKH